MTGLTDLDEILASLEVERRPSTYTVVPLPTNVEPPLGDGVAAVIAESEGTTVIATVDCAQREGWPVDFVAAWLTLTVHSSLDAVGLTARFSEALAQAGISCNVIAGYFHDHLLVPVGRADEAIRILEELRRHGGR